MQQGEPHGVETGLSFDQGQAAHPGEVAGQHGGPAHGGERQARRLGHRVGHHAGQGALAQLPGEQAADELGLSVGGPAEQVGQPGLARGGRSGTARTGDFADGAVDIGNGQ